MRDALKEVWGRFAPVEKIVMVGASALVAATLTAGPKAEFSEPVRKSADTLCTFVCG